MTKGINAALSPNNPLLMDGAVLFTEDTQRYLFTA